jgi:hypothetical protein
MAASVACPRCSEPSVNQYSFSRFGRVAVVVVLALLMAGMLLDTPRHGVYSVASALFALFVVLKTSQGVCRACGASVMRTVQGRWK